MAYPAPSTALSGAPGSFWFVRNADGRQSVCSTNGYSLLSNVQAAIQGALASTGPLPSFGGTVRARDIANIGTPVYGEGVGDSYIAYDTPTPQSTSGWDVTTLRGLYALAQRYHASRATLSAIEADARRSVGSPLSSATVGYATWLAYDSVGTDVNTGNLVYGRGSPASISFATNPRTTYPLLGVLPPIPAVHDDRGNAIVDPVGAEICAPATVPIATESAITVATTFSPNAALILAVIAAAAVGAMVITKRAPRLEQIRGRRSNPTSFEWLAHDGAGHGEAGSLALAQHDALAYAKRHRVPVDVSEWTNDREQSVGTWKANGQFVWSRA